MYFNDENYHRRIAENWRSSEFPAGTEDAPLRLLCAVSGGKDSMCLLWAMHNISLELNIEIAAAHYNHRLRGGESDRDESFVMDFCKEHGIDFYRREGDVEGYAGKNGKSIEESARELRYSGLYEMAEEASCSHIATAHTAEDNAETILINLARGSGLKGLCGIPPKRDNLIRPLLCLSRNDVEDYLLRYSIPNVEDSTNAGDDYGRNKLRHHAVPVLKELNSSFIENSMRASLLLRQDEEFLEALAQDFIDENFSGNCLPAAKLSRIPPSLFSRVLRLKCPRSLSAKHIDSVIELCRDDNPSGRLDLPGITLHRQYDMLTFGLDKSQAIEARIVEIGDNFTFCAGRYRLKCFKNESSHFVNKRLCILSFKSDRICGNITLRSRMPGDKIRLQGRGCTKSLKALFQEAKLPKLQREMVPILCDDSGVIAVYGFGVSENLVPSTGDSVIIIDIEETLDD